MLSQSVHVEEMGELCLYKLNRCSKTTRKEQKISYKVKHLVISLYHCNFTGSKTARICSIHLMSHVM